MAPRVEATLRFSLDKKNMRAFSATQPSDVGETYMILGCTTAKFAFNKNSVKEAIEVEIGGTLVEKKKTSRQYGEAEYNSSTQYSVEGMEVITVTFVNENNNNKQLQFTGSLYVDAKPKSREEFRCFGTITVGTGSYKKLFGNTAVLKYNIIKDIYVLRIFNK